MKVFLNKKKKKKATIWLWKIQKFLKRWKKKLSIDVDLDGCWLVGLPIWIAADYNGWYLRWSTFQRTTKSNCFERLWTIALLLRHSLLKTFFILTYLNINPELWFKLVVGGLCMWRRHMLRVLVTSRIILYFPMSGLGEK